MSENQALQQVIQILQGIGAVGAALAVGYAIKAYKIGREKRQFDLSKNVQDDLLNFSRELAFVDKNDDESKTLLYERLFNSLEWLGFLINEKQITNDKIRKYFKNIVIQYYDNTFLKTDFITDKQRSDENEFKEFKKLYHDYKNGVYD